MEKSISNGHRRSAQFRRHRTLLHTIGARNMGGHNCVIVGRSAGGCPAAGMAELRADFGRITHKHRAQIGLHSAGDGGVGEWLQQHRNLLTRIEREQRSTCRRTMAEDTRSEPARADECWTDVQRQQRRHMQRHRRERESAGRNGAHFDSAAKLRGVFRTLWGLKMVFFMNNLFLLR